MKMRILEYWFWKKYWLLFIVLIVLISILTEFSVISVFISLFFTWLISKIITFLRKQRKEKYRVKVRPKRIKFFSKRRNIRISKRKKFTGKINMNYLPNWAKEKSEKDFNKGLRQWKKKHPNKKPTKSDLYRIAINSSHDTLKTGGAKGHWGRQKIRKRVLEGKRIVKKYKAK